jgi:hydroxyethylthiazole kinase-like uncharacterized protein yjeF
MSPTPPSRPAEALDGATLRAWPLPGDTTGSKHDRGTVLVIGGTARTPGAVLLAGVAALRAGAGRLQIVTASDVAPVLAVAVPEAIVVPMGDDDLAEVAGYVERADAVVVGPGLLDADETRDLLDVVLRHAGVGRPIVVDAAALEALANRRPPHRPLVLTPNRGEVGTLLAGADPDEPERAVADRYGAAVTSFDLVVAPDGRSWRDPLDVEGLGTSGSGDVLAGAVGALAARCGDPVQAACWATLAHRTAARRLARRVAGSGYLARELADELPQALAEIAGDERAGGALSAPRS